MVYVKYMGNYLNVIQSGNAVWRIYSRSIYSGSDWSCINPNNFQFAHAKQGGTGDVWRATEWFVYSGYAITDYGIDVNATLVQPWSSSRVTDTSTSSPPLPPWSPRPPRPPPSPPFQPDSIAVTWCGNRAIYPDVCGTYEAVPDDRLTQPDPGLREWSSCHTPKTTVYRKLANLHTKDFCSRVQGECADFYYYIQSGNSKWQLYLRQVGGPFDFPCYGQRPVDVEGRYIAYALSGGNSSVLLTTSWKHMWMSHRVYGMVAYSYHDDWMPGFVNLTSAPSPPLPPPSLLSPPPLPPPSLLSPPPLPPPSLLSPPRPPASLYSKLKHAIRGGASLVLTFFTTTVNKIIAACAAGVLIILMILCCICCGCRHPKRKSKKVGVTLTRRNLDL